MLEQQVYTHLGVLRPREESETDEASAFPLYFQFQKTRVQAMTRTRQRLSSAQHSLSLLSFLRSLTIVLQRLCMRAVVLLHQYYYSYILKCVSLEQIGTRYIVILVVHTYLLFSFTTVNPTRGQTQSYARTQPIIFFLL